MLTLYVWIYNSVENWHLLLWGILRAYQDTNRCRVGKKGQFFQVIIYLRQIWIDPVHYLINFVILLFQE
jgi:hypothetical protein